LLDPSFFSATGQVEFFLLACLQQFASHFPSLLILLETKKIPFPSLPCYGSFIGGLVFPSLLMEKTPFGFIPGIFFPYLSFAGSGRGSKFPAKVLPLWFALLWAPRKVLLFFLSLVSTFSIDLFLPVECLRSCRIYPGSPIIHIPFPLFPFSFFPHRCHLLMVIFVPPFDRHSARNRTLDTPADKAFLEVFDKVID